ASDPASLYKVDLLVGDRLKGIDLTLVESFIRRATEFGTMNEVELLESYGEVARVLRHLGPLSSDEVASRIINLYRRHSLDVNKVMDEAFSDHASEIRESRLSKTCAIVLAVPDSYKQAKSGARKTKPIGAEPIAAAGDGIGVRGPG